MRKILIASTIAALCAATAAIAAENTPTATGKPGASSQPTPPTEGQMDKDTGSMSSGSSGASTGSSGTGTAKDLPGSSDSKKKDSSLSTNGSAPKQ